MKKLGLLVTNTTAELVENVIVKRDGKYWVESEEGKNLGGPYDTRAEAEERLAQVEFFKNNEFTSVTLELTANKAQTRYETLEGKQYLVVPCVMLTEGVHNGSQGALYYPAEELAKTPAVWNAKPVVVYHPQLNGQSISACDQVVFEKQKIGILMNTKWEDGKLKTECWIDEEKANAVDERVLEAINNGQMMEVSTGLFTDNENVEGTWNEESYTSIARNYRPDHLAILPDLKGACSIDDGAGLLRNQAQKNGPVGLASAYFFSIVNELSHSDIWQMLNDKIRTSESSNKWVMEVFDSFFIYEDGDKLYYQEYSIEDDEVKLVGVRKEAEKITQYQLSDGALVGNKNSAIVQNSFDKEKAMKEIIDALIANEKSPFTEEDREYLEKLSEEKLKAFAVNTSEDDAQTDPPADPPAEGENAEGEAAEGEAAPQGDESADDAGEAPAENSSVEDYIANAPAEMQGMLRAGVASYKAEKKALVEKIVANKRNTFTKEHLEMKDVPELKAIAAFADEPAPKDPAANADPVPLYLGQGEPVGNETPAENAETPLIAPSVFDEVK